MKDKIFDNLLWTRMSIRKINAKKLKSKKNIKHLILYFHGVKNNLVEDYENYYDKVSFIKSLENTEIVSTKDAYEYLENNKDKLKEKKILLVGYHKSIAWVYRYLKNLNVKVAIVI